MVGVVKEGGKKKSYFGDFRRPKMEVSVIWTLFHNGREGVGKIGKIPGCQIFMVPIGSPLH